MVKRVVAFAIALVFFVGAFGIFASPSRCGAQFSAFDTDSNGLVSTAELDSGLRRSLGGTLSEVETNPIFRAADANSDGNIDFGEFDANICSLFLLHCGELLSFDFAAFDADSGTLDFGEFVRAFVSQSQQVAFEESIPGAAYAAGSGGGGDTGGGGGGGGAGPTPAEQIARVIFDNIDTDNNGLLTPEEFDGQGFCWVVFAAFDPKVKIEADKGEFEVRAPFTLGVGSNGIDPTTEEVTLRLGAFRVMRIPGGSDTGSFKPHPNRSNHGRPARWTFGLELKARIVDLGGGSFELRAEGKGADLAGVANPLRVTLNVGNDGGSATVNARFH